MNETLANVKSWKDFLFFFTFFFNFKGFLTVFFCVIIFALQLLFVVSLSYLQLLVAFFSHGFHFCGSLLHVVVIAFIFVASSLLRSSLKFHHLCLLLHYFVVCFVFASLHCSPKLLEKSSLFPCSFFVLLSISSLLSITTFSSF